MVSPRRFLAVFGLLTIISWGVVPSSASALRSDYFDFGPYYQPPVLGLSLSSLENLPNLNVPAGLMPAPATGVLPDSPLYNFEKIAENVQLAFTFDPVAREETRFRFAEERLSEAKSLIDAGKTESGAKALVSYRETITDVAQNLPSLAEKGSAAQELINKVEETVAAQEVVATSLSLASSPQQAEIWTKAASAGKDVLDKIAEAKGEPAMPEDLSSGIQKLKEQGLISEEESNKLYGYKSRSEVRDELDKLASSGMFPISELAKMDDAMGRYYPDVYEQYRSNLQVVELRAYQGLPQPSAETIKDLEEWQKNPDVSPSNAIKPYLWYNRAQDLAREVDLSDFSRSQQTEFVKFYPQAVSGNPTYTAPTPTPTPSATPEPQTGTQSNIGNQTATQAATPSPSPQPGADLEKAEAYLGEPDGALPGEPAYLFKQFGEQVQYTFTFDRAAKARLRMEQAERRLAESLKLAADPGKAILYESTIRAYKEAMVDASTNLKQVGSQEDKEEVAKDLESQAARHEVVLEKGLLPPPPKNPEIIKEAILANEDAMDRSADAMGRPALPPVMVSRLEDLKAEGLILAEEVEDLTRSASREEVREKVRKLAETGTFPPADAKKMDEAQVLAAPADYNQLVEVRKVEELQALRSVQTEIAQTPTLKNTAVTLGQKETALIAAIDPTLIDQEDLGGKQELIQTYQALVATASARPMNVGQFGLNVGNVGIGSTGSAEGSPRRADAVLSACPEGAIFKQFEGCVWADSGKSLNDYEQYRCEGSRQYYSFAARKCVAYDPSKGFKDDSQPICPVGYTWSWQAQGCQAFTGGGPLPLPSPTPEPEPISDEEIAERSKLCPEGSSYKQSLRPDGLKAPNGCVWDKDDKSVYNSDQYRCGGRGRYYSFEQQKCVASPKEGEPYPKDSRPTCKEPGTYWSWDAGQCVRAVEPQSKDQSGASKITTEEIRPTFTTPDSPFYFLKAWGENVQETLAFTPQAKGEVKLAHARERLAEGYYALEKADDEGFKEALAAYATQVQEVVNDLSSANLSAETKKTIGEHMAEEVVEQNLILQKASALADTKQNASLSTAVSATVLGVDKAADLKGEDPIPPDVKKKIESLPVEMISEEDKKKILESGTRVEARLSVGDLSAKGLLKSEDAAFLNEEFKKVDPGEQAKINELKRLAEIATVAKQKEETLTKVEKNEGIVQKLGEFQKTFEAGGDIPADVRPYARLTRIEEVAQTVRPDVVKIEDFANRKDLVLAVATLQQEFKPTKEALKKVEEFRKKNPNAPLPFELARIEALSYSLGVREQAGPCFLPTPPFPANTPCPAPGAAIPVSSYYTTSSAGPTSRFIELYQPLPGPSYDKDGKPLVYGQGPKPSAPGICQSGYHWMYDSGGWCMADSGSYGTSYQSSYTPSGYGSGYTPYSSYYTAPGAYPATSGYPVGDNSPNDGCPYGYDSDGRGNCIPNSYPSSPYSYGAPSYYGPAPSYYTTTPPAGTVPGSGPKPTAPGQCPSGFHWMSDAGGWCMADGNTYVPSGLSSGYPSGTATSETPPPGGYNCGSQPYDPVTKRCKDGACPGGFNWDGSKCVAGGYSGGNWSGTTYYGTSPTNCGPGYTWNGYSCQPSSGQGSSCAYPSGGCPGAGAWYDYSSCSCRTSSSTTPQYGSSYQYGCTPGYYWDGSKCTAGSYEGSGWSDSAARSGTYCQPPSSGCGSNYYWDYGSCSCRSSGSYYGGSGSSGSGSSCSPPSGGCGSGWFDYGSCSCKQASSQGCYNVSASSCGSGWYFDAGLCTCRQNPESTTTSGGTSGGSSSGGSSSGSCPSGYHWMSDNGGWCMSDGGSSSSGGSTSTSPSPTPAPTTESSSPPPTTESSSPPPPAPTSEPTPPPPTTESAPTPAP